MNRHCSIHRSCGKRNGAKGHYPGMMCASIPPQTNSCRSDGVITNPGVTAARAMWSSIPMANVRHTGNFNEFGGIPLGRCDHQSPTKQSRQTAVDVCINPQIQATGKLRRRGRFILGEQVLLKDARNLAGDDQSPEAAKSAPFHC